MTSAISAVTYLIDGSMWCSRDPEELMRVSQAQGKKAATTNSQEQTDQISLFLNPAVPSHDTAAEIAALRQKIPENTKLVAFHEGRNDIKILPNMTPGEIEQRLNEARRDMERSFLALKESVTSLQSSLGWRFRRRLSRCWKSHIPWQTAAGNVVHRLWGRFPRLPGRRRAAPLPPPRPSND
jgi:hypothetical protein